jgi:hypothetical protein
MPALIGNLPNQVPTNGDLGSMAFQDASNLTIGNLAFTGTGNRIIGDFSNATVANRVAIQTSTTNGTTVLHVIPNGSSTTAVAELNNASDPTNSSTLQLVTGPSTTNIRSATRGSGTYLPMVFETNGTERMRIDTGGNVGIGTSPAYQLDLGGGITVNNRIQLRRGSDDPNQHLRLGWDRLESVRADVALSSPQTSLSFIQTGSNGSRTNMLIDSSGRVLVGLTSANASGANFQVSSGITFPATQSASSDANTLDDYEEGSWTPIFNSGNSNHVITANSSAGRYIKIGGMVWLHCQVHFQCTTAGTGAFFITGLPFVASSINGHGMALALGPLYNWNVDNSAYQIGARVNDASASIYFWNNFDASTDSLLAWPFAGGGTQIYGSITGCYRTD